MGEIFFIRHGQASFGGDDYDVLSPAGREQSLLLADFLCEAGFRFDSAYCGTLKRQAHTAEVMLERMNSRGSAGFPCVNPFAGLNEYHSDDILRYYIPILVKEDPAVVSLLEGIRENRKTFQQIFERVVAKWLAGENPSADIEGWEAFRQRVRGSLEKIMAENDRSANIAVISSGGVISAAIHLASGISPESANRMGWELVNSSITRFRFGSSGLRLHSFNCYTHLENSKYSHLITYR